jgi:hypothetical protein
MHVRQHGEAARSGLAVAEAHRRLAGSGRRTGRGRRVVVRPARPETPRRLLESAGEPVKAAVLIDERAAALAEANRHVTAVESALDDVPIAAGAGDDLRSLLDFLVRRDL